MSESTKLKKETLKQEPINPNEPLEQLSLERLSFNDEHCSNKSCGCKKSLKRTDRNDVTSFDIFGMKGSKRFCGENYSQHEESSNLNLNKIKIGTQSKKKSQKSKLSRIVQGKNMGSGDFKTFGNPEAFINFKSLAISSPSESKTSSSYSGQNFKELRGGDFSSSIAAIINETKAIDLKTGGDDSQTCSQVMPSCSQEAMVSCNDDWSTDELSSYFEYFCHIPKNMSDMAKMMYA